MNETQIRTAILDFCTNTVRIENGMGGTPGLPDLLYFPNERDLPRTIGLELKSPKNKLSRAQKKIACKLTKNGLPYMFLRFELKANLFILYCLKYPTVSGGYMWMYIAFSDLKALHEAIIILLQDRGNCDEKGL